MPQPVKETVKKAWPSAIIQVFISNRADQRGFRRYSTPAIAPGSDIDFIAKIRKRTRRIGIAILFNFSIPFDTPQQTIIKGIIIAIINHGTEAEVPAKVSKYTVVSIVEIVPVMLKVKYFSIQPTTTE